MEHQALNFVLIESTFDWSSRAILQVYAMKEAHASVTTCNFILGLLLNYLQFARPGKIQILGYLKVYIQPCSAAIPDYHLLNYFMASILLLQSEHKCCINIGNVKEFFR